MLSITVPGIEHFNEESNEFSTKGDIVLELEHSLVSLSKWESIFEKPFLGSAKKSTEEVLTYVEAMVVSPNYQREILGRLSEENMEAINDYLDSKMTATWFSDSPNSPKSKEVITAELIYFWMIMFNIPWEAQHWHLNRLFTLIKVCSAKGSKPEKMSKAETIARNRELNAQRKAQTGTKG